MKKLLAWMTTRFDAWRDSLPTDPDPQPTMPSRLFDPHPERSELHSSTRYENAAALGAEAGVAEFARLRALHEPITYGRPQHIPEEVKARLRAGWDKVGDLEPVEEAARP
jgi:hypothetical protein